MFTRYFDVELEKRYADKVTANGRKLRCSRLRPGELSLWSCRESEEGEMCEGPTGLAVISMRLDKAFDIGWFAGGLIHAPNKENHEQVRTLEEVFEKLDRAILNC